MRESEMKTIKKVSVSLVFACAALSLPAMMQQKDLFGNRAVVYAESLQGENAKETNATTTEKTVVKEEIVREATCTQTGEKKIVYSDNSEETVEIPMKEHEWELVKTVPATKTAEGSKTSVCKVGGETRIEVLPKLTASWVKDENGYRYLYSDGSFTKNGWELIEDKWYYFTDSGYRMTGWLKLGNTSYFFEDDGVMAAKSWKKIDGKWYYFNDQGAMVTNKWELIDDKWYAFDNTGVMKSNTWVGDYYVNASGAMVTNAWVGNYYVGSDGAYVKDRWIGKYHVNKNGVWDKTAGWQKNNQGWWYLNSDGTMPKNSWKLIEGKWYYFNKTGYMLTNWQKLGSSWYYLGQDGAMKTGWQHVSGRWYYFYGSGKMAANAWINGEYYVKADGSMAVNEYISGYWLDKNGVWSYKPRASWKKSGSKWWYGDTSGWYARNTTLKIDNKYYAFNAHGYLNDSMDGRAQSMTSLTNYLILVDRKSHTVGIYYGKQGDWKNIQKWSCVVGKASTPTITGTYKIGSKGKYFDTGTRGRCWYYSQIKGNYLFHSVIYDRSSTPKHIIDGVMGVSASHGCVRLTVDHAKWIYDNVPKGTTVQIYN